jgi:hypothetical protein
MRRTMPPLRHVPSQGGPAGQLPGTLRRQWNNRKYGAEELGFSTRKIISPKSSEIWARTLKKCSPALL